MTGEFHRAVIFMNDGRVLKFDMKGLLFTDVAVRFQKLTQDEAFDALFIAQIQGKKHENNPT